MMRINNNLMAMNAHRYLQSTSLRQSKSLEKISSGLRINSAADDAAGLAISEKMRAQISGLEQAEDNAQNGISLIQTAEGALNEVHSILQRMRTLASDAANDSNSQADRATIQKEVDELASEITRISETSQFNTRNLLDGTFEAKFQIGASASQDISISVIDTSASAIGVAGADGFKMELNADELSSVYVEGSTTIQNGDIAIAFDSTQATESAAETTSVVQLEETVTLNSKNYAYALTNTSGNVVALSTDGQEYDFLDVEKAESALSTAAFTNGQSIEFTNANVTSGTVTITATSVEGTNDEAGSFYLDDISAVASEAVVEVDSDELSSGTYTVVGTEHSGISAGLGLVDSNNNLVGVTVDGSDLHKFISYSDSSVTLFEVADNSNDFSAGDEIVVTSSGGIDVSTQTSASSALETIDSAIDTISDARSNLGATQNRLQHTIYNLNTTHENLQAAESRIRDVDVAKEMMEYVKLNILQQASQSMLAQANQAPQGVLQLLG